eukprot:scaffold48809_cov75-Phaeocystis_antarctica.AAC.12
MHKRKYPYNAFQEPDTQQQHALEPLGPGRKHKLDHTGTNTCPPSYTKTTPTPSANTKLQGAKVGGAWGDHGTRHTHMPDPTPIH